jgi:hypothetical protein
MKNTSYLTKKRVVPTKLRDFAKYGSTTREERQNYRSDVRRRAEVPPGRAKNQVFLRGIHRRMKRNFAPISTIPLQKTCNCT